MEIQDEKVHGQTVPEEMLKLERMDIIAVIIAIYKVFLPWVAVIAAIYGIQLVIFDLLY